MNFKTFITGLLVSFSLAWLFMIALPFAKTQEMSNPQFDSEKDGMSGEYQLKRAGQVANGAAVYGANGCYTCHSQLIRPTYAGTDVWNTPWAGASADTARETTAFDYAGEKIAQVGLSRTGPDLSNVGHRIDSYVADTEQTAQEWIYAHLYNPSANPARTDYTSCPSSKYLFKVQEVQGQGSGNAIKVVVDCACWDGKEVEVVPTGDGQALVSYLLSMKKDDKIPFDLDPNPKKKSAN